MTEEMSVTAKEVKTEKKKGRFKKPSAREWQLYSMCSIPMLLVFIFSYLPMYGIIIAFKNYKYDKGIWGSEWVGFKNFEFFVTSNEFTRLIRNTIGMNAIFIVVGLIASVLLAFLLYELQSRTLTKIFQTTLITPHFMSWVVVAYMLYAFIHPNNGIVQGIMVKMGMDKVDFYGKPEAWPLILTIASVWKSIGMSSVIYYAALMGFDSSLIEAAKIDGAKKWQINLKIVLPSLIPIMTVLTIMSIGGIFRADFGLFYQLPRDIGALYPTTDVIDTYVFRTMRKIGDMGMSSAVGLLQSLVGIIMVVTTNAIAKRIDESMSLF